MLLIVGLRLGLELGLDLVSDWLLVMHTCLYYFPLSLSLSQLQTCERYNCVRIFLPLSEVGADPALTPTIIHSSSSSVLAS